MKLSDVWHFDKNIVLEVWLTNRWFMIATLYYVHIPALAGLWKWRETQYLCIGPTLDTIFSLLIFIYILFNTVRFLKIHLFIWYIKCMEILSNSLAGKSLDSNLEERMSELYLGYNIILTHIHTCEHTYSYLWVYKIKSSVYN